MTRDDVMSSPCRKDLQFTVGLDTPGRIKLRAANSQAGDVQLAARQAGEQNVIRA